MADSFILYEEDECKLQPPTTTNRRHIKRQQAPGHLKLNRSLGKAEKPKPPTATVYCSTHMQHIKAARALIYAL